MIGCLLIAAWTSPGFGSDAAEQRITDPGKCYKVGPRFEDACRLQVLRGKAFRFEVASSSPASLVIRPLDPVPKDASPAGTRPKTGLGTGEPDSAVPELNERTESFRSMRNLAIGTGVSGLLLIGIGEWVVLSSVGEGVTSTLRDPGGTPSHASDAAKGMSTGQVMIAVGGVATSVGVALGIVAGIRYLEVQESKKPVGVALEVLPDDAGLGLRISMNF